LYSQPPTFVWAKQIKGTNDHNGKSVVTDIFDNIYITGDFEEKIFFETDSLNSLQNRDMFVAKYDAFGNLLWAKQGSGAESVAGRSIATDKNGNCIVLGDFGGIATFGSLNLISPDEYDIYIAKYDPSGNVLWAKKAGGMDRDEGNGICTDNVGNIIITGSFEGTAIFETFTLTSEEDDDMFVAKYDALGNLLWVKTGSGPYSDCGITVSSDNNNNIVVGGIFSKSISFDQTTLYDHYPYVADTRSYIVKYDPSGNVMWANKIVGEGHVTDYIVISCDKSNNVIFTGNFKGKINLDGTTLSSTDSYDFFVAKYDAFGSLLWAKKGGGEFFDFVTDVAVDENENISIVGSFQGIVNFNITTLICDEDNHLLFIAKYDPSGDILWAKQGIGSQMSQGTSVSFNMKGNSVVLGELRTQIALDNIILTNLSDNDDIFITILNDRLSGIKHNSKDIISNYCMVHNYPNPFNSWTIIEYRVPKTSLILVEVFNVNGQRLRKLVDNEKEAGVHKTIWDGLNEQGENVGSGIYIYKMQSEDHVMSKKMVLIQ